MQITPQALKYLKEMMGSTTTPMALNITKTGCSGMSYALDKTPYQLFNFDGLPVLVHTEQMKYLPGLEISLKETELGCTIQYNQSKAIGSCGCGKSFAFSETDLDLEY
jgi:iron-sulfur cluster assembly protein